MNFILCLKTLAKKTGIAHSLLHVTLAKTKEVATSSVPGIVEESAAITTGSLSRKTNVFESKWEVAGDVPGSNFSLNDNKCGVCLKLLPCEGFMVNGSKGTVAFHVEKRDWRERNSFVGKLLQLLQIFRGLPSAAISSNLLEIAVFKNLKYCIHRAFYEILLEKLFARFLSSAIVILCLFEYLMGYIDRGGWATYSDTSWEFRATYVSIELRLAAYFWFKFRALPIQTPSAYRGQKRSRSELKGTASICKKSNKFVPKLKTYLPIEGKRVKRDVWLGDFNTYQEAEDVYWIGAFYYDEQDRLSNEILSWLYDLNLPPLPPNLSIKEKASWVREKARECLTRSRHHDQDLAAVEQYLAAGYVAEVTSGTWEGDLFPIEDILRNSGRPSEDTEFMLQTITGRDCLTESTRTDLELYDSSEDITVGDCYMGTFSTQGEVGVGSEGLNPLGICPDQSVYNQQDFQHFQLNHGCASVLEGGGYVDEVGASLQQDEIEEYHVRRAPADHSQAMDFIVAQEVKELKMTDTIRFTIRELHRQGWDLEIQSCDSTEISSTYTISREGQGPILTGANWLVFDEINNQGYRIILKPLNIALPQVSSSVSFLN